MSAGEQRTASAVDKRLGAYIRVRRQELGMSQEQLADSLGVTFQQIQKYEKGLNRIAASRLFDICVALDLSLLDLFEQAYPSSVRSPPQGVISALGVPGATELLECYASIPSPVLRKRMLALARAMTDPN